MVRCKRYVDAQSCDCLLQEDGLANMISYVQVQIPKLSHIRIREKATGRAQDRTMYVHIDDDEGEWAPKADIHVIQIKEKRLHVPLVDRLPEEAPPLVVAVVGPPGVCTHGS